MASIISNTQKYKRIAALLKNREIYIAERIAMANSKQNQRTQFELPETIIKGTQNNTIPSKKSKQQSIASTEKPVLR